MIDPNEPLPTGERITQEERARRFVDRRVSPEANPRYAVRVLVPRTWEPLALPGADEPVNATRLTPLAGWQDPAYATAPAMFHVQAIGMPREMTAAHFVTAYALDQGLTILAMRPVSDVIADALLVQMIKGQKYIVRMAACFDGDRAYIAMGLAHRADYGTYADVFGVMIGSIRFEHPTGRPHVEERVTRTVLDTVAFEAPISFRAKAASGATETHRALDLYQKDPVRKEFCGLIRADVDLARRAPTFEDEMVYVAAHLMNQGVTLGEPTEVPIDVVAEGPVRISTIHQVSGTRADGAPVEAWIALGSVDGAALRVWMLGPAREANYRQWAVNQRGFRVIMKTLRRASPSATDEPRRGAPTT